MWGFNTGGFLFYSLSFLEKLPHYLCSYDDGLTYKTCEPATSFCEDPTIKHKIDWDDRISLHNWVERLDLACKFYYVYWFQGTSKAKIGLLGSIYFAGWAIAAILLPRLSDMFGRKKVYLTAMSFHFIFWVIIICS